MTARAQRGYTLLEVMVAFALLAIGLGLLLAVLSGGVRSVARSGQTTQATLYAESLLDNLGADRRLRPGRSEGMFEQGRYRWTLEIAPFKPPLPTPARGDPYATDPALQNLVENVIYRVVLQVQWGARGPAQTLRIDTLRAYAPLQVGSQ